MSEYNEALRALNAVMDIDIVTTDEVVMFVYGWLTAKGVPCDYYMVRPMIIYNLKMSKAL